MLSRNNKTIFLLILTLFINFYRPSPFFNIDFFGNRKRNIVNRLYLSLFTGFIIVLTDVILCYDDFTMKTLILWILFLVIGIITSYYMLNNQIFVNQDEFLLTLKENHEMDINITKQLVKKNKLDDLGLEYANSIINNRTNELSHNQFIYTK
jgi:uncharacterized membrane protein YczE